MSISLFFNQLSPCVPIADSQINKSFRVMIYRIEAILRLRGKKESFQESSFFYRNHCYDSSDDQHSFSVMNVEHGKSFSLAIRNFLASLRQLRAKAL